MLRFLTDIDFSSSRSILLLVTLTIVIPTACIFWFMNRAMESERLAEQEKLGRAYRASMNAAARVVRTRWEARIQSLRAVQFSDRETEGFEEVAASGGASSVVLLDKAHLPVYPARAAEAVDQPSGRAKLWDLARQAEFQARDYGKAVKLYGELATSETTQHLSGQAFQAQARCYAKDGDIPSAVMVSGSALQRPEFAETKDAQGRLIAPNALLYAIQLRASGREGFLDRLVRDLNDYSDSKLPSQQRVFLMRALVRGSLVSPETFPTMAAEQLANQFLDQESTARGSLEDVSLGHWIIARFSVEDSILTASLIPDVWRLSVSEGRTIFLFDTRFVQSDFERLTRELEPVADFVLRIYQGSDPTGNAFASTTIGGPLPGWRIDLRLNDPDTYERAADSQLVMLFWVGSVCVGLVVLAGSLSARAIGKQARLARMKNDLVATVSHELKTPIASVKVLVDTLLEGHFRDEQRMTEYLELISSENERLARLVGNFLTFSRLEQSGRALEMASCDLRDVVDEALRPIQDRLASDGFEVLVEIDEDVPEIDADRTALVTAVSNLVENAAKFSEADRRIQIRAARRNDQVCVSVEDHGIGMSKRDARRVFGRFYQVDTRLARTSGGVGLGLSIVKGVADGHGGACHVTSVLGEGSTFELCLPISNSRRAEA